ncbi:L-serine ammonia-lyase [Marinobacter salinisoli]|uniref:L-serine dehydratase n=1 Tax=Marinobacter salinisoli TaxID=2769486 RepID=A0ABX7MNR4_9GAMM|nr:L-serine ammonia-lyase [Marinobacter salinisoli]QSP93921.1 L-serine ammonia-lyase [Marinobacter salinisoli]
MSISVFDLFKIGIGPSSSHTTGPMVAGARFAEQLEASDALPNVHKIQVQLFGSLSATGVGHGTDHAVVMGLMGYRPDTVDPDIIAPTVEKLKQSSVLSLLGRHSLAFDWHHDLCFEEAALPYHPNGLRFHALDKNNQTLLSNTFYSIGGGFVIEEHEATKDARLVPQSSVPFPFNHCAELLALCNKKGLRISQLVLENEKTWRPEPEIRQGLMTIWAAIKDCVATGLSKEGPLPGGLGVERRAKNLHESLLNSRNPNVISSTLGAMDWVNLYALAVNEENACGGRMVTAPTNGAAGIIPAVLMYYMEFEPTASEDHVVDFLLAASAIGALCKENASISGAEVGCQGEVGSACAMAAAGLCEVLGGSPEQVENAAEIGLEHNLGLTCDPVGGLVQVPCIERNAIAAVKAINAAQMALRGSGKHFISLDKVIGTMRETGKDMQDKYKETSRGGLAVNTTEC